MATNLVPVDRNNDEIERDFRFLTIYKDGRIQLKYRTEKIPPSDDPVTGAQSKDVTISTEPPVSARIFLPKTHDPAQKLPILYYIHGGGFCLESAFSPIFHNHLMALVAEANVIAVSLEYELFPERPIPGAYDDGWVGLQWISSHAESNGPEPWLNNHADFTRFFMGGDSGGANISNYLAVRIGPEGLPGVKFIGMIMVHPYFGGMEDDEMWLYMSTSNGGLQDPKLKPPAEDLAKIGCEKVLILFAENDHLRGVGGAFYEDLKKSGYGGTIEVVEHEGESHEFHLFNPTCDKAVSLVKKIASFLNQMAPIVAKCDRSRVLSSWAPYCGGNYRFGYKAAGDALDLVRLCEENGIVAYIINSVMDKNQDHRSLDSSDKKDKGQVSSSRVRHALDVGDMRYVSELLGRQHRLMLIVKDMKELPNTSGRCRISAPKSCMLNQPPKDGLYGNCFLLFGSENQVPCRVFTDTSQIHLETDDLELSNYNDSHEARLLGIEFGECGSDSA